LREDSVLIDSVAFFQATFFILQGLKFFKVDLWFQLTIVVSTVLFFVFRGYGAIRDSNRNRFRSIIMLIAIPLFDVVIIPMDLLFVFVPRFLFIPASWIILLLTFMAIGLAFSFLRVMLVNRYKLPHETLF